MRPRHGWWLVAVLAASLSLVACSDGDDDDGGGGRPTATASPAPTATATPTCDLPFPFCGGDFPLNTEMTTAFGPAWADVVLEPTDFLPCYGPYALCYYANCEVAPDGQVSACPCYEWFGPNFVLMTAILNSESYQDTIAQCTADPASCQKPNGAPVCRDINRGEFFPGATRISTFSFYRANVEPIGSTNCTQMPGPYAGCMTAPCAGPTIPNPDGTVTIACDCPIYDGPFQIGKSGLSEFCDELPNVWSAAYNTAPPPDPCAIVGDGSCIPDAPTDQCGCPLYSSSTVLPPDSGVDCGKVCNAYATCLKDGSDIQLGFTCDATLCTSNQQALVLDACLGLQDCDLSEVFKAESAADCSCCASQLCNCAANGETEEAVFAFDAAQREQGETPQCDINGTLCGTPP